MRTLLRRPVAVWFALAVVFAAAPAFADATVFLINGDAPGVGLNDPTPRAPVAGNTGTTVGQQRLIALQHAADIWGSQLDSPVPIGLIVSFGQRACTPTGAVLASAGAWNAFANFPAVGAFPGPVRPDTWHHSALADKRAGADVTSWRAGRGCDLQRQPRAADLLRGPRVVLRTGRQRTGRRNRRRCRGAARVRTRPRLSAVREPHDRRRDPGLYRRLRIAPARHVEPENLGPDDGRRARGVRDQLAPAGVERHGGLRRRAISALVRRSGAHHHRARRHRRHLRGRHRHLRVAAHRGRHRRSDRPGARRGEPRRAVDHGRVYSAHERGGHRWQDCAGRSRHVRLHRQGGERPGCRRGGDGRGRQCRRGPSGGPWRRRSRHHHSLGAHHDDRRRVDQGAARQRRVRHARARHDAACRHR